MLPSSCMFWPRICAPVRGSVKELWGERPVACDAMSKWGMGWDDRKRTGHVCRICRRLCDGTFVCFVTQSRDVRLERACLAIRSEERGTEPRGVVLMLLEDTHKPRNQRKDSCVLGFSSSRHLDRKAAEVRRRRNELAAGGLSTKGAPRGPGKWRQILGTIRTMRRSKHGRQAQARRRKGGPALSARSC